MYYRKLPLIIFSVLICSCSHAQTRGTADKALRMKIASNIIGCYRWVADEIDKGNEKLKESLLKATSLGGYVWLGCYDKNIEYFDSEMMDIKMSVDEGKTLKGHRVCYYISTNPGFSFKTGDYIACEAFANIDGKGKMKHWRKYAIYYGHCQCFKPLEACLSEEEHTKGILEDMLKENKR